MKLKYLSFLLFCTTIYSQTDYIELKTLKASEIMSIEAKFNSEALKNKKNTYYDSSKNLALPKRYSRKATENFPASVVEYSYSKSDSLVKQIVFYWEIDVDEKDTQAIKVRKYNLAFDQLVESLSKVMGNPKPNQGKQTEVESPVEGDESINYERKVVWKINSKTVTAMIVWAENHGQQMITTIKSK